MTTTELTVVLPRAVEDNLEYCRSSLDEIAFLGQIETELPILHQEKYSLRFNRLRPNSLRIYRGRVEWCGVDFLYVRHESKLHILKFEYDRFDDDTVKIDVHLGSDDTPLPEDDEFIVAG